MAYFNTWKCQNQVFYLMAIIALFCPRGYRLKISKIKMEKIIEQLTNEIS